MLEDPRKFLTLNFPTLSKKNPKMACLAPVWYQKEQSHEFWWASPYPCRNARLFSVIRAIMAPPPGIGLNKCQVADFSLSKSHVADFSLNKCHVADFSLSMSFVADFFIKYVCYVANFLCKHLLLKMKCQVTP